MPLGSLKESQAMKDPRKELALAGMSSSDPRVQAICKAQTWEEQRRVVCQQRGVSLKGEQTNKEWGWGGAQCDFGRHLLYPQ